MKLTASAVLVLLCAVPHTAAAQTGTAPFCLQTTAGTRCVFGTMGDCERTRGSTSSAQCITRSDAHGTTGLGEPPEKSTGKPTLPPMGPTYGR